MRRLLNGIYTASGVLGGLTLVSIAAIIAGQIAGRLFGLQIPAADDFVAWMTAASTFLGLGYTFHKGAHIRVELILGRLPPGGRHLCELVSLTLSLFLTLYGTWACAEMTWESYVFHELAQGQVALPLWIPQSALALGMGFLAVAVADDFHRVLVGGLPSHAPSDLSLTERAQGEI